MEQRPVARRTVLRWAGGAVVGLAAGGLSAAGRPVPVAAVAPERVENGAPYDATAVRWVPELTGHPQSPRLHEYPVYLQINRQAGWAFAIHGPQDPRFVGRLPGQALPPAGTSTVTGQPRSGETVKPPIPFVHTFVFEWPAYDRATGERLPGYYHLEGGIRIRKVVVPPSRLPRAEIWYLRGFFAPAGASPIFRPRSLVLAGNVRFVPRLETIDGVPELVATTSPRLVGGLPANAHTSVIRLAHLGHPAYPPFQLVTARIDDARYNSGLFADIPHNRYGFAVNGETSWVRPDGRYAGDPKTGTFGKGDELPLADVPKAQGH